MLKKTLTLTLAAAVLTGQTAAAAEASEKDLWLGTGAGAVAGTLVAGPLGFVVGSVAGNIIGKQIGERNALEIEQQASARHIDALETALDHSRAKQQILAAERDRMARDLADVGELRELPGLEGALALDVLFRTGADTLEPAAEAKLRTLAAGLGDLPRVRVQLQGHTDRRGDADTNLALSERRAQAVKAVLTAAGIPEPRIQLVPLGETRAVAEATDLDGLALDRRVTIRLEPLTGERLQAATNPVTAD